MRGKLLDGEVKEYMLVVRRIKGAKMGIGLSTGTMEYDDGRRGVFEGRGSEDYSIKKDIAVEMRVGTA